MYIVCPVGLFVVFFVCCVCFSRPEGSASEKAGMKMLIMILLFVVVVAVVVCLRVAMYLLIRSVCVYYVCSCSMKMIVMNAQTKRRLAYKH